MLTLTLWVTATILMSSINTVKINSDKWLTGSVIILLLALTLTFSSQKIIHFYFWLEVTLIPTIFLILGWGYQPERLQASMYLLIYTLFGSLPFLVTAACLGLLSQGALFTAFKFNTCYSSFAFIIIIIVLLIKLPIYPLHLWLPKAHVEAPLAGSIALAGVLLKLGVYGIILFMPFIAPTLFVSSLIIAISIWGGVLTSAISIRQTDIKSLIAYSSIGHIGFILLGLISQTRTGVKGAVLMAIAHGLGSPALLNLAALVYDNTHSRRILVSKRVISLYPVAYPILFMGCAANISAPPLVNLLGEVFLASAAVAFSNTIIFPIIIICLLVGAYSLYLFTRISHGSPSAFSNSITSFSVRRHLIIFINIFPLIPIRLTINLLIYQCSLSIKHCTENAGMVSSPLMILSIIVLTLAASIILATSPLQMVILIIGITLSSAVVFSKLRTWLALILVIIYVGGMLVAFAYLVALCPNQPRKLPSTTVFLLVVFTAISKTQNQLVTFNNGTQITDIYLQINLQTVAFLISILLLAIVIVVKIVSRREGPLRPFAGL